MLPYQIIRKNSWGCALLYKCVFSLKTTPGTVNSIFLVLHMADSSSNLQPNDSLLPASRAKEGKILLVVIAVSIFTHISIPSFLNSCLPNIFPVLESWSSFHWECSHQTPPLQAKLTLQSPKPKTQKKMKFQNQAHSSNRFLYLLLPKFDSNSLL